MGLRNVDGSIFYKKDRLTVYAEVIKVLSDGHSLSPGRFMMFISLRICADPIATVRLEELC